MLIRRILKALLFAAFIYDECKGFKINALYKTNRNFVTAQNSRAKPSTRTATVRYQSSVDTEKDNDNHSKSGKNKSIFIFGLGYVGTAVALECLNSQWKVSGTCTNIPKIQNFRKKGIRAYLFDDDTNFMSEPGALNDLLDADYILSTIPPVIGGSQESATDPVLNAHGNDIKRASLNGKVRWIGYLSSTGIYGGN